MLMKLNAMIAEARFQYTVNLDIDDCQFSRPMSLKFLSLRLYRFPMIVQR